MGMKASRKIAKERMFDYIDRRGIMNFSVVIYAEQVGIPLQTISRWKTDYMKKSLGDIETFGKELAQQNQAALKILARCMEDSDAHVRIKAARTLASSSLKVTDLLERYGMKTKEEEEMVQPQLHIHASDKDLYDMLPEDVRKQLARMAEAPKEQP